MLKQYLQAGKIVSTHGVKGELKVYPYCDSAEMVTGFRTLYLVKDGKEPVKVVSARAQNRMALLKIEGVDTVEEARVLIDSVLFFDRADVALPDGAHFIDDLLGAEVSDADTGEVYGVLADVTSTGAHDVYHIKTKAGAMRYIPAVPEFVASVDAAGKKITVRPIPGMVD